MSVTGDIVEVRVQSRGSQLVGDHTSGASSIVVADPTDFDTAGGMLLLDGTVYTWTSVTLNGTDDEATATLAITPNLAANEPDTMPVELWSGAQVIDDVVLTVDAGGDTPAYVSLRSDQRKDWTAREGYLEPPVPATFSDDFSVLLDADGYTPAIDLANAENTPPSPLLTDGLPPSSSPVPVIAGAIGALAIQVPAVTNADPVFVNLYVGTSNPVSIVGTPTATIAASSTGPVAQFVRVVGGLPVSPLVTYYARTVAFDADGAAAASSHGSGSPVVASDGDVAVSAAMLNATNSLDDAMNAVTLARVSASLGQVDTMRTTTLATPYGNANGLIVNSDSTGDWKTVLDPMRTATTAVASRATVLEGIHATYVDFVGGNSYTPTSTTNVSTDLTVNLTSTGTSNVWVVGCEPDVQITTAGTVNVVEVLVDGTALFAINTAGAANDRVVPHKQKSITGQTVGTHAVTVRTRNTAAATGATVRSSQSVLWAERKS